MEILYEGIGGSAPQIVLSIILWLVAGFLIVFVIWDVITFKAFNPEDLGFILVAGVLIFGGFVFKQDMRYKEVKAIINDTASYKEISEKYEQIRKEGDIYVFKVKDDKEL